ncbi:MAG: hypothetical protein HY319_28810 [Armatimonadetes bacterium]|nr:hypothetical protein [Armatimonadota bacterium]
MEKWREEVELVVDGQDIPLSPFVRQVLSSTVRGLIAPLRGVERPDRVELRLGPSKARVDPVLACHRRRPGQEPPDGAPAEDLWPRSS